MKSRSMRDSSIHGMSKKEIKNKLKSDFGKQAVSLMSILLLFISMLLLFSKVELKGIAHFFLNFQYITIYAFLFPIPLFFVVENFVTESVESGKFKNANRMLYAAISLSVFYLIVIAIVNFSTFSYFSAHFLYGKVSRLSNILLFISLVLYLFIGVYKAYYKGFEQEHLVAGMQFFQAVVFLVAILIFPNAMMNYGKKVAGVLSDPEVMYAYGAAGVSIAVLAAMLAGIVGTTVIQRRVSGRIFKQVRMDGSKRNMDIADLFRLILERNLPILACFLLFFLPLFINQCLFTGKFLYTDQHVLATYQLGGFFGVLFILFFLPAAFAFYSAQHKKRQFFDQIQIDDYNAISYLYRDLYRAGFSFSLLLVPVLEILAPIVGKAFCGQESAMFTRMIRIMAPMIPLICVALIMFSSLLSMKKQIPLLIISAISFAIDLAITLICYGNSSLGIYGFIIGLYVQLAVFVLGGFYYIYSHLCVIGKNRELFVIPVILVLADSLICFLLRLLFGLFMPSLLMVLLIFLICSLAFGIAYCRMGCMKIYTFASMSYGAVFYKVARFMRLIK